MTVCILMRKKEDVDFGGWKNEKDLGQGGKLINILYKKIYFHLKKDKTIAAL